MTYAVCLQTMVFCLAEPKTSLPLIQRNVRWLEQQQKRTGQRKGADSPAAPGKAGIGWLT
jgi:hypothetical protein